MAVDLFKKKQMQGPRHEAFPPPLDKGMPPTMPPIRDMRDRGMPPGDIARTMKSQGHPPAQIGEGMEAAGFPYPAAQGSMPPPPPPPPAPKPAEEGVTLLTEDLEEISEAIIEEKWKKFTKEWDQLQSWRENTNRAISDMQATLSSIDSKMNNIEQAVLGKVKDYEKTMSDVNTELKAMQKVFKDVLPTFTEDVKKLSEITQKKKK